jgi:serine phosphatase RsbU (regulator of sigma subunit)
MAVEAQRLPFEGLARVAERLAAGGPVPEAFVLIAAAAAEAASAEVAVVFVRDEADAALVARAVAPGGSPRAAELSGARLEPGARPDGHVLVKARIAGRTVGAIELVDADESRARAVAEIAAGQLSLALRLARGDSGETRLGSLRDAGDALAAGAAPTRVARQAATLAAGATGAVQAVVWEARGETLQPIAWHGQWDVGAFERARALALESRAAWQPLLVDSAGPDTGTTVSIRMGEPTFGVLQLRYAEEPRRSELDGLLEFAARVAHALRLGSSARDVERELERTRALLAVVGDAISHLSLAHTLDTAVDRIAELLAVERVGVYLYADRRLTTAAGRDLDEGHEGVARALLGIANGPLRARETIEVRARAPEPPLEPAARALAAVGVEAALAVPLRVHDETTGLLVIYPGSRRTTDAERALLAALAAQLAVAVQNARLHEESKELGEALASVLGAERQAALRLRALYQIANSFTRTLSLEQTLQAVTETVVEVLDIDAAVIRLPDERGDELVPGAVHVADETLSGPVRAVLDRPHPRSHLTRPLLLDVDTAERVGGPSALLVPFLQKGSTAAIVPIVAQAEPLAQLTIVSLDPLAPITGDTLATAATIAGQAALAVDNARLYQQQKMFAETIQRALLPGERPDVPGVDLGAVYESAARLDVGGDVYDFVTLGDGRIAIVLGDVTGHGVDATADMAMAKFVFRSLVREHPEPDEFLAHANDVISDEIGVGKFITMVYVLIDADGRLACASAGHPAPRIVLADGTVQPLTCGGLALGIDGGRDYDQQVVRLPDGAAVVLYTDGVVEARSGSELYGVERLDACLSDRAGLPAQALAAAVLADCRAFAGGELRDDCAVVVARKS